MIEEFFRRNLTNTTNALCKLELAEMVEVKLDPKEMNAIALQNTCKFRQAYYSLLCTFSTAHIDNIAFCSCCGSLKNFLRNYSLLKVKTSLKILKDEKFRGDVFTKFIEASISREINDILEIIRETPLFWDAYLLLIDVTDTYIEVSGPLSKYYVMHLKVIKDIDPIVIDYINSTAINMKNIPYEIEKKDLNLLAAFAYSLGDIRYALSLYNKILKGDSNKISAESTGSPMNCNKDSLSDNQNNGNCFKDHISSNKDELISKIESFGSDTRQSSISIDSRVFLSDIRYFEFLFMILYGQKDHKLKTIVEVLSNEYNKDFETYVGLAVLAAMEEKYQIAEKNFKKALRLNPSPDVYCMLGHTYVLLKDRENAQNSFGAALKKGSGNFRILYTIAQGHFLLDDHEHSLFYCKRALEIRTDGSLLKLMGRIYMKLNNYSESMHCLEKAESLKEYDALLYMAELFKKSKKPQNAVALYEKYISVGDKNKNTVLKYLIEYFEEHGDPEKAMHYRSRL